MDYFITLLLFNVKIKKGYKDFKIVSVTTSAVLLVDEGRISLKCSSIGFHPQTQWQTPLCLEYTGNSQRFLKASLWLNQNATTK